MSFLAGDKPTPPPAPPPPPNAPTMANANTQALGARQRMMPNSGTGSTLLTGGGGLSSPAITGGKSLLGQ
jgi:hypothetical protein